MARGSDHSTELVQLLLPSKAAVIPARASLPGMEPVAQGKPPGERGEAQPHPPALTDPPTCRGAQGPGLPPSGRATAGGRAATFPPPGRQACRRNAPRQVHRVARCSGKPRSRAPVTGGACGQAPLTEDKPRWWQLRASQQTLTQNPGLRPGLEGKTLPANDWVRSASLQVTPAARPWHTQWQAHSQGSCAGGAHPGEGRIQGRGCPWGRDRG